MCGEEGYRLCTGDTMQVALGAPPSWKAARVKEQGLGSRGAGIPGGGAGMDIEGWQHRGAAGDRGNLGAEASPLRFVLLFLMFVSRTRTSLRGLRTHEKCTACRIIPLSERTTREQRDRQVQNVLQTT